MLSSKLALQPFTWKAAALFIITGGGLYYYFQREKEAVAERKRAETAAAKVGRPRVGGPFSLTSHEGKPFTHEDLLGKFVLIYFGFTNCPDICPEELDKMSAVVESTDKKLGGKIIQPVFVSCDPARDSVEQVREYIKDFHPRLIGLTGSYDDVKAACKAYRVYFSTPPNAQPTDDYLVDHSIYMYLMDPHGQFVDAYGKNVDVDAMAEKVGQAIEEFRKLGDH